MQINNPTVDSMASFHEQESHEVVFISAPAVGLLVPTVEFARLLVAHHPSLSATLLLIQVPHWPTIHSYTQSLPATSSSKLRFRFLPTMQPPSPDHFHTFVAHISTLVERHKAHVREAIEALLDSPTESRRVAGLFVDMLCTSMIDVAHELGIASYLFFASPASFLSFTLDLPILDQQLGSDSLSELSIRGFANSVPRRVLPTSVLKRGDGYSWWLYHARRYMETKAVVVNTFKELEPFVLESLHASEVPKIYPLGPVLDRNGPAQWSGKVEQEEIVMKWLDKQPTSSVVFLCFGSMGSLSGPQVREIALGLERAQFRFLWSLRQPPKNKLGLPDEFANVEEALPSGFLEQTREKGMVCGWVPQVRILGHEAIGGFVSHCGWNSILESLWYGVPIATWPVYAEQQMNAWEMVKELKMAVEIRVDYREGSEVVRAEELEKAIRKLMEDKEESRAKVRDMREKRRRALMENGSSFESLRALIEDLVIT